MRVGAALRAADPTEASLRVFVLAAALAALAACGPPAAETPPVPAPAPPAAAAPAAPLTGAFSATSTTAMGVTGDLTATDARLSFGKGFMLDTAAAGPIDVTTAIHRDGPSFAQAMTLPTSLAIELRRITALTNAADASAQPLCGADSPTYVALAYDTPVTAVSVAVFSGADAPGPDAVASALCGTFTYNN